MKKLNITRRNFVAGSAAVLGATAAGISFSGCSSKTTQSGLNPKNFETNGVASLGTGLETQYSANIPTKLYTISNKNGAEMCVTNFGARMVSLMVPGRNGKLENVIVGFRDIRDYATFNTMPNNFYGAVVGRFGNRIGKGKFSINGVEYQCDVNEDPNLLHGGRFGFHFQTYEVVDYDKNAYIRMKLVSPDGDMGFPGEITLYVTYSLNSNNTVGMFYEVETTKETVINVTNHNYWDVSGDLNSQVTNDRLFFASKQTTPIDSHVLTTGEIVDIPAGDPFDFYRNGKGKLIGDGIDFSIPQMKYGKGYDHNFCIMPRSEAAALGESYDGKFEISNPGDVNLAEEGRLQARFHSDVSGITMTIVSTEPGIQFYDGYDLDGSLTNLDGKKVTSYGAIALEPQHYPDWPNHANFPSNYVKPGQQFASKSEYRFTVE